jgi:beta-barrel assembly-enhancing protease
MSKTPNRFTNIVLRNLLIIIFSGTFITITGCETNPVTGKQQLLLVSTGQELSIGEQQYKPSQQSQGGIYTIDPNLNRYINNIGQQLAKLSGQPNLPYEFVVLNNDIPNAWALPGGKIAINRGLLILLEDESQLAAVLGHEIVHAAARHGATQMSQGMLLQLGTQLVGQATGNDAYTQLAGLGASAVQARYGQSQELEADYYGINYMASLGYDPLGAVELQQTFLRLSEDKTQGNWLDNLFASHPPSAERVQKNLEHAKSLPKGKRNKVAYQQAIKQIKQDQSAYKLHEDALSSAGKKQWESALSLTNKAIQQQDKEARFFITQGRLLNQLGQNKKAIEAFNQATTLEPKYFAGFFYRGLSYQKTGQNDAAERDFLASNTLLETATANYYLGEIALAKNQRQSAIDYYRRAVQGGGESGKAAAEKLQQLGIK